MISWYFQHLGVNQINLTETFLVKWAPVFESVFLVVTKTTIILAQYFHVLFPLLFISATCCYFVFCV